MRHSHENVVLRKIWIKRLVLVLFFGLALVLASSVWGVFEKYREARERKEDLSHAYAELQKREADLSAKVEALETERGVESEIRSKFKVAKEGEGVIYLVEDKAAPVDLEMPPPSNWEWFLGWFGF